MSTTTHEDTITELANAIQSRDAEAIIKHYADEATLTVLDRDHPPANPLVIAGRSAIGDYYRDVCGRNIEHQIKGAVSSETGLGYAQHCRYPDGAQVVCLTVATTKDGLIVDQTAVQTWDEA